MTHPDDRTHVDQRPTARDDPQPGIAAKYEGVCPRCERIIHVGDRVAFRRGEAIHCGCASGADDQ